MVVELGSVVVLLSSARMRSEGTVVGSVCLSVTLHLTSRMFVPFACLNVYIDCAEGLHFSAFHYVCDNEL